MSALKDKAASGAQQPPVTVNDWQAHVISGVGHLIQYLQERTNVETGDRCELAAFFRGARIYAAKISHDQEVEHIEKMRHCHIFNHGDDPIIDRLKRGWRAYRQNVVEFDYSKDKPAILSWHYQMFLGLGGEYAEDYSKKLCRYCGSMTK